MKILLATDGSSYASAALNMLQRLPLPPTCHVTVLTVLEDIKLALFDADMQEPDEYQYLAEFEAQRGKKAARLLEAEAQRLSHSTWTVDTLTRNGEVANQIIETARELDVDLIVMGFHGLGRVERFLLGSISRKVVEYGPCSVLVVKPPTPAAPSERQRVPGSDSTATGKPIRFLVALDGSAPAKAAMDMVVEMASQAPIRITIVRVLALSHFYRTDILEQMTDSWQRQNQAAEQQLRSAAAPLMELGVDVSFELREGSDVSQEILAVASEDGSDVVVAGHKGRSGIQRFLLGGVSRRLVCHAGCSVWIHRDRKTGTAGSGLG